MERNILLARFIALWGVRNTKIEYLNSGITQTSKTGDFSDVIVVTPYGNILWKELSRISDLEMRELMLDIEYNIQKVLDIIPDVEKKSGSTKEFEKSLEELLFTNGGASWDVPDQTS